MKKMENILALDTSMSGCSAAVYRSGEISIRSEAMPRGQSERLMPMIEEVREEGGIEYEGLDVIAVTIGPGAFTGVRIGLATARALSLSLGVPLYGVNSLQVLAWQYALDVQGQEEIMAVTETRRDDFYVQIFDHKGNAVSELSALAYPDVALLIKRDMVLFGDGLERFGKMSVNDYKMKFAEGYIFPDPGVMAEKLAEGSDVFKRAPEPLYLRGADVSEPKVKPRKIV